MRACRFGVILAFVTSFVFSLFIYPLYAEAISGDRNNNGIEDLTAYFNSDFLSRIELDRNEDGKADAWFYFVANAEMWDTRADYDENNDGRVDEVHFIKDDEPIKTFLDKDFDGLLELETLYQGGTPTGNRKLNPPLDPAKVKPNF